MSFKRRRRGHSKKLVIDAIVAAFLVAVVLLALKYFGITHE